jgi:hypothetical protein
VPALLLQGLNSPLVLTAGFSSVALAPTPGRHTASDRPVHGSAAADGSVQTYPSGAVVVLEDVIVDDTGAALAPDTLTLTVTKPDRTTRTYQKSDLVEVGANHFALFLLTATTDPVGVWTYQFVGLGTGEGADTHRFRVGT